jgi:uncharacterized HAD superfamily protein
LQFKATLGKQFHKTLSQKNPSQKRTGRVAQGVGPEFKPYYSKKKKKILLQQTQLNQHDSIYFYKGRM